MKFNKWTVALAAIGVVNLTSATRAQAVSQIQTALSNTTLSGYVDTSAQWNLGSQDGGLTPPYTTGGGVAKADGFNLDAIDLALDKPEDESPWASGYHVELMAGPDSIPAGTGSPTIRQAYLRLRTPIGNGIDWQIGIWDTIIGYESSSLPLNPNYTHGYNYIMEPTTHTGILATYKINDELTVQAGIADSSNIGDSPSAINGRLPYESQKAYMGAVAFTAPDSWGWAKGATLSSGIIDAPGGASVTSDFPGATSIYVGATVPTPNTALKFGGSFDYLDLHETGHAFDFAGYSTYQVSEKLSLNGRAEYFYEDATSDLFFDNDPFGYVDALDQKHVGGEELTLDVQYNLWANVLSRVEARWDHVDGRAFDDENDFDESFTEGVHKNAYLLAAELVYQF
jgi:hypothetical protein